MLLHGHGSSFEIRQVVLNIVMSYHASYITGLLLVCPVTRSIIATASTCVICRKSAPSI